MPCLARRLASPGSPELQCPERCRLSVTFRFGRDEAKLALPATSMSACTSSATWVSWRMCFGAGDLFADIGANAGSYSVLAAGITGAAVVAVEPAPDAFARLQANIVLNDLNHLVQLHCCAVGSETGTVKFSTSQDTTNHVIDSDILSMKPYVEVKM